MNENVNIEKVDIDFTQTSSDYISPDFFGANYIIGKDSLSGTYSERVEELGVTSIRYPGGEVAEKYFDLTNINSGPVNQYGTHESIVDFLEYCNKNGIQPTIVIPTKIWKYHGIEEGKKVVGKFISDLTSGYYGDASDALIEIGNEYWSSLDDHIYSDGQQYPGLTGAEYGEIAAALVSAVTEYAKTDVNIAVQIGKTKSDNNAILEEFEKASQINSIDLLVYHDYFWTEDSISDRTNFRNDLLEKWRDADANADIFISEWNVGSNGDANTDKFHDYGLAQVSAIIEFVSTVARSGVQAACIWAIQQNNKTSLFGPEGHDLRTKFAGYIYNFIADHLIGSRTVEAQFEAGISDNANINVFENADEIIIFVSAKESDQKTKIEIDLDNINLDYSGVEATNIKSTWENPNDYRGNPDIIDYSDGIYVDPNGSISLDLDEPHEVIVITIPKVDPDRRPIHEVGTNEDDTILGTEFGDTLIGKAGDDDIRSGQGNDKILGGDGDDFIFVTGGNNKIVAGNGNDTINVLTGVNKIHGGEGNDFIYGGANIDYIYGGAGNDIIIADRIGASTGGADTVVGGQGDDILAGGMGSDTFIFHSGDGNDIIGSYSLDDMNKEILTKDFEIGVDKILLKSFDGINSSNVFEYIEMTSDGALLRYEDTSILIYGVNEADLSASDFIFT